MTWLRIGEKILEIEEFRNIGGKTIPVLKTESEEIRHPDGRVDVIVKVPCLNITNRTNEIN